MFSTPFVLSFALLLSLPLLFLLAPRILPPRHVPISLPDELDDLALFRRAALASSHSSSATAAVSRLGTTNPPPKIAFFFLTNSDLTFAPLWERFFKGNEHLYKIYIHADPSAKVKSPGGVFEGRFITAKKTHRASATLISAARRLLATALLDDPSNTFFALLSQHCVPLHSFRFVYHSLFASSPADSSDESDSYWSRFGRVKYRSFIEILDKEPTLWDRYTARGKGVMMPEVPFEDFRVGSQFFVLTRRHALLVIKDRRLWRKFRLPCLKLESCYPEEHYFPTLLSMEDPKGCTHYSLTNVNWTGSINGHPHTYRSAEVSPELVYRLRFSNSTYSYLFARKFSADCLQPLLEITDSVIFRD
ncbi:glycosyltransferase BC10-like [Macadamia integrifolia]|uniref:glycosyltransferase BC10-like n=1 Tax=Macadamia integrifolia TaxID=60698 RepID=UPI001C4F5911|nr:glycosyltransferase BC10-like [Macadamia integrifolia]